MFKRFANQGALAGTARAVPERVTVSKGNWLAAWTFAGWLAFVAIAARGADVCSMTTVEPMASTLNSANADAILSLLVHKDAVFASTAKGLYRGSPHDKKWVRLSLPDTVPLGGFFGKQPANSSFVYYVATEWQRSIRLDAPSAARKTLGLYRLDLTRDKWELVSSKHSFVCVYVQDDRTLFGTANIVGSNETPPEYQWGVTHLLMSKDSGAHWDDITHGVKLTNRDRVRPDPDHEGLICLSGYRRTGAIFFQARSKAYDWKENSRVQWERRHPQDEDYFFCFEWYCKQWYSATLTNYFNTSFGERIEIPSFQIVTGGAHKFNSKGRVIVPVEVTFLSDAGDTVTIVDTDRGRAVWGLRCKLPDGTPETIERRAAGASEPI